MDRRSFLISGASAVVAAESVSLTTSTAEGAESVAADLVSVKNGIRLSQQERDRRWGMVRERMARDGILALVTAPNTGEWDQLQGDARFLSCIGGNCAAISVVFPVAEKPTVFIPGGISPDYWLETQNWVTDVRRAGASHAVNVIERLHDLGLKEQRIGIPGLDQTPRNMDGIVSSGFAAKLREAFPKAQFVEVEPWLNDIRAAKSAPELEVLRLSSEISQTAAEVIEREARPGVLDRVVYARVTQRLLELGAEPPNMFNWISGPTARGRALGPLPTDRALQAGDFIFAEVEAVIGGYRGQATRTAVIGPPSRQTTEMFDLARDTLKSARAAMVTGAPLKDVLEVFKASSQRSQYDALPIIHARGLGEDAPVLAFQTTDPQLMNWKLQNNSTFVMKISVREKSGPGTFYWGDIVRVTPSGALLLGRADMKLLVCSA